MKTATAAFKAAQADPFAVSVRRVSYKRRYWTDAGGAYGWETNWTVLPETEVVSVSPVTAKLDTDRLNEFKISNVDLVLKNEQKQWKAGNNAGYFAPAGAAEYGFEPYWTKFKIESGYEVAGTAVYLPLFTGVAVEFNSSAGSDTIQVSVQGLEALLINANAENVSTTVTGESLGTGDGSTKDFTTLNPGVGIIRLVSVDGIPQKAGTDYTVSQLNEIALGAKISFTNAPAVSTVITVTYVYWKQVVYAHDLVKDLLTEAGIPTLDQDVDDVVYSYDLEQRRSISTYLEWSRYAGLEIPEGDTDSGVTIDETPGSVRPDIQRAGELIHDFNSFFNMGTVVYGTWGRVDNAAKPASTSGGLALAATGLAVAFLGAAEYGMYRCDMKVGSGVGELSWYFFTESFGGGGALPGNGYMVSVTMNGSGTDSIGLYKKSTTFTQLGSTVTPAAIPTGQWTTFMATRDFSGRIRIYRDGVLLIDATDTTYNTAQYMCIAAANNIDVYFDNLYRAQVIFDGAYTSQTFDLGGTPTEYGPYDMDVTLAGAAQATKWTNVSSDGVTWDGVVNTVGTTIMSAKKRFIRLGFTLVTDTRDPGDAIVHSVSFSAKTRVAPIALANFTGKTVYDAIQDLAGLSNYEWGFKEDETFFFRSKEVDATVDETLDSSINLLELTNITDGVDRVYSEVQAVYGEFDVTVSDDGSTRAGPLARFGKRRLTLNGGDLLLSPEVDVATGVAKEYFDAVSRPRREFKARTKLMEWVDLSDTVTLTFADNVPAYPWHLGDTTVYLGQPDIFLFGDAEQSARNTLCKVVGYRHDTQGKISEFDLEEILT